jgi:UDP-N-acetyl-D-mannosaminuronic acid dehydrogenase
LGYNRTNIPVPSPGVGGTCLSKDPYILLDVTKKAGYVSEFIRAGRKINERMPVHVVERVKEFFEKNGKGKNAKVFVMGFAFKAKPVTSDTRNSPTIPLVKELKKVSSNLWGFDPQVSCEEIESQFGVKYCSIEEGFKDADCVIIMLNSDVYTELDIFSLLSKTKKPVLFYDGWQLFKRGDLKNLPGVYHEGVGFGS